MNTALATSYWFDYCEEEKLVLEYAKKHNPTLAFEGSCEALTRIGNPAVVKKSKVEICKTKLVKTNFFQTQASFKVTILEYETNQLFNYKVIMKNGSDSLCQIKSIGLN